MKLDRDYMLNVIANGGSIILNGMHYSKENVSEFPSVADLALGDKEAEKAAKVEIEAQLQALLAEKAKLEAEVKEKKSAKVKDETN